MSNRWYLVAGLLIFVVVNVIRIWPNLSNPGLYVEDAIHYFNKSNHADISFWSKELYFTPNGYYAVFSSFFAAIISFVDVRVQPLIYTAFAFLMTTLASVLVVWSGLFRRRELLMIAPLVLGVSGINTVLFYTAISHTIYPLVLILLSLLFYPAPKTTLLYVLFAVVGAILAWSGPHAALAIPATFGLLVLFGERRKNVLLLVIAISAFICLKTQDGNINYDLFKIPTWADIEMSNFPILRPLKETYRIFVMDVCFLGLIDGLSPWHGVMSVASVIVPLWCFKKERVYVKAAIIVLGIAVGSLLMFFLSTKFPWVQMNVGHVVIAIFFWLVYLLMTCDQILSRTGGSVLLSVVAFMVFGTLIVVDNIAHPNKYSHSLHEHIDEFLQAVHDVKELHLEDTASYVDMRGPSSYYDSTVFSPEIRIGSHLSNAYRLSCRDILSIEARPYITDHKQITSCQERYFVPTYIDKLGEYYFIVDSYNNRILYSNELKPDIDNWKIFDRYLCTPFSMSSNGSVYIVADTDSHKLNVYRWKDGLPALGQSIRGITKPHNILYDQNTHSFYIIGSHSKTISKVKETNGVVTLMYTKNLPLQENVNVRSVKIIDGLMYLVLESGHIQAVEYKDDSFNVVKKWTLPESYGGPNDLVKVDDYFLITTAKNNILRCLAFDDMEKHRCQDVFPREYSIQGSPSYLSYFDSKIYFTQTGSKSGIASVRIDHSGKLVDYSLLYRHPNCK